MECRYCIPSLDSRCPVWNAGPNGTAESGAGMRHRYAKALVLALVIGSAAPAGVAHAAPVACGQVITQDTVLEADVGPCPGPGLVLGADNITLDLGGHTLFGAPSSTAPGILVEAPFTSPSATGVRIRNGSVTGFGIGVSILRSVDNVVERLLVAGNHCHGIQLLGIGGGPFPATRNVVRENVVRANGCAGVDLIQNASGNIVERNQITGNVGSGVRLQPTGPNNSPRRNIVRHNLIEGNGGDGITESSFFNTFLGNVIRGNSLDGVRVQAGLAAGGSRIEGNQLLGNGRHGVLVERFRSGNEVLGNIALANAVFDLADENPQCSGTTWAGNTFGTRNQPCIS